MKGFINNALMRLSHFVKKRGWITTLNTEHSKKTTKKQKGFLEQAE